MEPTCSQLHGLEWTAQPGHTLTLLSPLVVVNLLPYELLWEIKALGQCGIVKPGKASSIHTVTLFLLLLLLLLLLLFSAWTRITFGIRSR